MAYTGSSVAGGEGNTTFHATSKYDGMGKELEIFTVDFVDDMSGQTAKGADQNSAENCIRIYGNIVGSGPLHNSDTEKTYISEGTDMFVGSPASSGGTFTFTETTGGSSTATLQAALVATSGQNGSTTATNKTLVIGT
jgi:hypothetical protein|tara:strand:+ start:323 stop:736 length:414 start_codon:yes stop_codon:yes gene_type:complete